MRRGRVRVYADAGELDAAAARLVERCAARAIARSGIFTLALAGGSTPKSVYERLASEPCATRIDWPRVRLFFGDERCVPPDHPASNFRMVNEALISRLETAPARAPRSVLRIKGEAAPEEAAREYEEALRRIFHQSEPRFDLILLGLGDDGHTASLFPTAADIGGEQRWVVATQAPHEPRQRVSLSLRAINAARTIAFLVKGAGKAKILASVLDDRRHGDSSPTPPPPAPPAALVRPTAGRLYWLVDRAAAALL